MKTVYTIAWTYDDDPRDHLTRSVTSAEEAAEVIGQLSSDSHAERRPILVSVHEGIWRAGQGGSATGLDVLLGHPWRSALDRDRG